MTLEITVTEWVVIATESLQLLLLPWKVRVQKGQA